MRYPDLITIKASQKIFTYAEVTRLTGIGAEHLERLAKRHRLGLIAPTTGRAGDQTERWFFNPSDLMVLTTLFRSCAH